MKKIYLASFVLGVIVGLWFEILPNSFTNLLFKPIILISPNFFSNISNIFSGFFSGIVSSAILAVYLIIFFLLITLILWKFIPVFNKHPFYNVKKINLYFSFGVILANIFLIFSSFFVTNF